MLRAALAKEVALWRAQFGAYIAFTRNDFNKCFSAAFCRVQVGLKHSIDTHTHTHTRARARSHNNAFTYTYSHSHMLSGAVDCRAPRESTAESPCTHIQHTVTHTTHSHTYNKHTCNAHTRKHAYTYSCISAHAHTHTRRHRVAEAREDRQLEQCSGETSRRTQTHTYSYYVSSPVFCN